MLTYVQNNTLLNGMVNHAIAFWLARGYYVVESNDVQVVLAHKAGTEPYDPVVQWDAKDTPYSVTVTLL